MKHVWLVYRFREGFFSRTLVSGHTTKREAIEKIRILQKKIVYREHGCRTGLVLTKVKLGMDVEFEYPGEETKGYWSKRP